MTDETALMQQIQQGQLDKLAVLFERHHVSLYNYFLRSGNSPALSEDLVQETFTKILAYRQSYSANGTFKSWMYGIAKNTMADQYRGLAATSVHVDADDEPLAANHSLQENMEQKEKQSLFEAALQKLPVELKESLVLSRYQQLNYEEISTMVGCNVNTFKSRIRKALSLLQSHYQVLSGEGE
ncbi:MAG: sigma-70 family RNA polymerase sigma factor [Alteromonadaceae bacterium]|nr:sigma-70 family RNA polymerase sigma factor [Alteromonadaceae bacterium]